VARRLPLRVARLTARERAEAEGTDPTFIKRVKVRVQADRC
jgi:hypothetical protein